MNFEEFYVDDHLIFIDKEPPYEVVHAFGDEPIPFVIRVEAYRADGVTMRYIGRFTDGSVFSTSPEGGKGVSSFGVKEVIPGMSAALQLMRPGDRWRITMPPYLAYGPGRPYTAPAGAAVQAIQQRGIPANATLVFDVELVSIVPPASR